MRQLVTTKQGHERLGKWGEPFIKSEEGGFSRKHVTDQDSDKIDEVVGAKACTSETHLLSDGGENALMGENLSKSGHFSHPGGSRGL
jgi:hypothetical protein